MEITRQQYNNAVAQETVEVVMDALQDGYDPGFIKKFQRALIAHCELVGRRLFNDGPESAIPVEKELEHLRDSQPPAPGGCVSVPEIQKCNGWYKPPYGMGQGCTLDMGHQGACNLEPDIAVEQSFSEQLEAELEPRPGRYHVG
jgi:hypothetical protein